MVSKLKGNGGAVHVEGTTGTVFDALIRDRSTAADIAKGFDRTGDHISSSGCAYFYYRFILPNKSGIGAFKAEARRAFAEAGVNAGVIHIMGDSWRGFPVVEISIERQRIKQGQDFLAITERFTRIGEELRDRYKFL